VCPLDPEFVEHGGEALADVHLAAVARHDTLAHADPANQPSGSLYALRISFFTSTWSR
jgi:hypothetical protein